MAVPERAVPSDGTRLADFIHKRLFDSYATWTARQFLTWSLAEDHPPGPQPSSVLTVEAAGSDAGGAPPASSASPTSASTTGGPATTPTAAAPPPPTRPPRPPRPGPDAGDGPWTVEFAVEVTPLDA